MGVEIAKLTRFDTSQLKKDTPDNSVKSWWAVLDGRAKVAQAMCQVQDKAFSVWQEAPLSAAATPEARERIGSRFPCDSDSYRRVVDEVKTESETRAVVLATIWKTTTPPAGASESQVEDAKLGTRYRYVLERVDGTWAIADVYRYVRSSYGMPERWDRTYPGTKTRYFVGTVYMQ